MASGLRLVVNRDTDVGSGGVTSRVADSRPTETAAGSPRSDTAQSRIDTHVDPSETRAPADIDLEQLYPASAELNTKLSQALVLLSQGLQRLDRAIDYVRTQEQILADDQVHHLVTVLDELFYLRELSEGFASVVNGCVNAIRNLNGQMATESHLLAVNSCLLALRKKPFISFDSSLEMMERLEAAGLDVDTPGTRDVVQWLGDESAG